MDDERDRPAYPEPHEWVDKPDPVTKRLIDEAMDDLDAGRYVVCESVEAFRALLDELAAHPKAS